MHLVILHMVAEGPVYECNTIYAIGLYISNSRFFRPQAPQVADGKAQLFACQMP